MRRLTCAFLQESGQKLRLPQLSIATAIVFFHRFYASESYEEYDRFTVATTCLFLASKVEETPKKLKEVVIETYKAHHQGTTTLEPESKEFWELKEKILVCERILLTTLGFNLSVEHAYRPLLAYVKSIQGTRDLAQVAWNFINDSLRTTICLQYAPRCLAAAAAHLAAKFLSAQKQDKEYKLPDTKDGGKWYTSFQCSEAVLEDISKQILDMYEGNQGQAGQPDSFASTVSMISRQGVGVSGNASAAVSAPAVSNGAKTSLHRSVQGFQSQNGSQPSASSVHAPALIQAEASIQCTSSASIKAEASASDAPGAIREGETAAGLAVVPSTAATSTEMASSAAAATSKRSEHPDQPETGELSEPPCKRSKDSPV